MAVRRSCVDKKYEFEYDIGHWTFGTMAAVKSREDNNLRICKTVPKVALTNPSGAVQRLLALKELKHPHICSITDVMEDRDNIYILSEFCAGGEVSEWVNRLDEGYWIQEQTCVTYLRQTLLAIVQCHASRLVHRDLNPSTLQLTSKLPDAQVKVCDVGLAAILDADGNLIRRHPTPYLAPEVLNSGVPRSYAASDLWSIGAIAHTLLVGQPPANPQQMTRSWSLLSGTANEEEDIWESRSSQSRDFVMRMLKENPSERPTPARALQHPWLRGMAPMLANPWDGNSSKDAKESRHKTLCYMLSVLLIPVLVPHKDFDQLRLAFTKGDSDGDGIISNAVGQQVLLRRLPLREATTAALDIVDIGKSDVLDMCAVACADLIAREFFGNGPSSSPLVPPFGARELVPRMLKRFFEAYGEQKQPVTTASSIKARSRTGTARDMEENAGVNFKELLDSFPQDQNIDSQALVSTLTSIAGRGTPLACNEEVSPVRTTSVVRWGEGLGFMSGFLYQCGLGSASRRDESPV